MSVPPRDSGDDDPALDATDAAHPAWWRGYDHGTRETKQIQAAVAEAVARERERCAKLAEEYGGPSDFCPNGCSFGSLADDIRRGSP